MINYVRVRLFASLFVCLSICPQHNSKKKAFKVFKVSVENDLMDSGVTKSVAPGGKKLNGALHPFPFFPSFPSASEAREEGEGVEGASPKEKRTDISAIRNAEAAEAVGSTLAGF